MNRNSTALSSAAIANAYSGGVRTRDWSIQHYGGFDAVTFQPVACCRFRPNEGGQVITPISVSLAPVSGELRSKVNVQVLQVFVPYQALDKLENPENEHAGNTEAIKKNFTAGLAGIGLEAENAITKACYSHGIQTGAGVMVQKSIRLAYIAACNHMRQTVYHDAELLENDHTGFVRATLSASVLQRFDGVLDPEPLADGAINLTGDLPVTGIYGRSANPGEVTSNTSFVDANGDSAVGDRVSFAWDAAAQHQILVSRREDGSVAVEADLSGAGEFTLRDLMEGRKMEGLIRGFAEIVKNDPVHGEEAVRRALYGLSMDVRDVPQVMFNQTYQLSPQMHQPMDAAGVNEISGHFQMSDSIGTIVPRTELGGQLITMLVVRPLERMARQPDPAQTEVWQPINKVHDELQLAPVKLTRAQLESDVSAADRDTDSFHTGHNRIKLSYSASGVNEAQTDSSVQLKSSMWDYSIPVGLTPQNINYPETLPDGFMYPFAYWNGAEAEYTVMQSASIVTTLAAGPSPIERLELFSDNPELLTGE